jgi:phage gp29-like protein
VVKTGASDDDQPYGRGLAEWLYWPVLFKRNGIRFWNIFLDKFSVPPTKGTYPRGATKDERDTLLEAMMALANDSGVALPEGMAIELLDVAKTASISRRCRPTWTRRSRASSSARR